jgi:putative peptidoglycan lipid II flippase
MGESRGLAGQIGKASAIIIIWSMIDKILAVGKEILTAQQFGVSADMDVFNITQAFPGTLVLLFSGALVSAFVPLYLEWSSQSSAQDADSHTVWLIYFAALFFLVLTLVCFFLTPLIIQFICYGFGAKEKQLGIVLERLLIILLFIDGAGIFLRGMLHAKKMFFHLYVAPIFVNITIIFFLIFDVGLGIYLLVWGFLIGTFLKTIYMGIALRREGFHFRTTLPFDPQKMRSLWLLAIPMLGSQLIANSNVMVDQIMATLLPAGSVSTLRYAFRINDLPIQVVITALSRAIFPFISEEAAARNRENLIKIYKYSLIFLGFLTIPITCFIILFSEDIVIALFKRGAFDLEASRQTAQTLTCYSLGLFFYAYTFVNGGFFAALRNTKTLLYMGIVTIFLNGFFNFVFMHLMGVKGIALSTSVTLCIISIYFIFSLKRLLNISDLSDILSSFYCLILSAACMLGAGFLFLNLFEIAGISRWASVPVITGLMAIIYLGIIWVFRTDELHKCLHALIGMLNTLKKERPIS